MKKIFLVLLSLIMLFSCLGMSAYAAEVEDTSKNTIAVEDEYYLTADEVINGGYFTADELAQATQDGAIILGGVNMPLNNNTNARAVAEARVWCRSYATYDHEDGVQVYVKLYMPWWNIFSNPKFTSMSGVVTVTLNSKDTLKAFYETADEERSIETDVDTGAKADSGTKGTVVVDILATGTNIEAGVGAWITSYEITIP